MPYANLFRWHPEALATGTEWHQRSGWLSATLNMSTAQSAQSTPASLFGARQVAEEAVMLKHAYVHHCALKNGRTRHDVTSRSANARLWHYCGKVHADLCVGTFCLAPADLVPRIY